MPRFLLAASLSTALFSATAPAATIFTSQAAFLAALAPGSYLEDFTGTIVPDYSDGGFSYTVSAANGLYHSGTFIGNNAPDTEFLITPTSDNVRAVGGEFFQTDQFDAFQPGITITITLSDGTVDTYTPASPSEFRGYVSTGPVLTSLTISAPTEGTYNTLDNVIVGTVVPEPGSSLLLAATLAVRPFRRRRSA